MYRKGGTSCFCPLFTFPAAVAESEKVLSRLHYTTVLEISYNPVTRSHHTTFPFHVFFFSTEIYVAM